MFEHFKQELLSVRQFVWRMVRYFSISVMFVSFSLVVGVLGFHWIGKLSWDQAFINAVSMLGAVNAPYPMQDYGGHLFTACYGMFTETVFLLAFAIVLAPVIHRLLHRLHLDV